MMEPPFIEEEARLVGRLIGLEGSKGLREHFVVIISHDWEVIM